MFPIENYYNSFIKKEIIGMKKEDVLKRLNNLLACPVISKETKESVHVRFFTCTMEMKPNLDRWIGTIALKVKDGYVIDSAVSVPKE